MYDLNIARKSRNIHFSSMLTRHWRKDVALNGTASRIETRSGFLFPMR